jgi:hypothetical protein
MWQPKRLASAFLNLPTNVLSIHNRKQLQHLPSHLPGDHTGRLYSCDDDLLAVARSVGV